MAIGGSLGAPFLSNNTNRSWILIGYQNPTTVYPSALVALVETEADRFWIYPDGIKLPVLHIHDWEVWASGNNVTLLSPAMRIQFGQNELLYAVDQFDVLLGPPDVIVRNLQLRISAWPSSNDDQKILAIQEFIHSVSAK